MDMSAHTHTQKIEWDKKGIMKTEDRETRGLERQRGLVEIWRPVIMENDYVILKLQWWQC